LERSGQPGIVLAKLDDVVRWGEASSLWPLMMGLACCAIEMMATAASRYDMARFGMEVFRASPRQADLMIVAGRASMKMVPVIKRLYDQMSDPKWVVSMGACASTSGVFSNYAIINGIDKVIPVDIYVPGCPPSPELLLDGLIKLQQKIRQGVPPGQTP
jgi:NADH-quinone oxidoreductase subunit B